MKKIFAIVATSILSVFMLYSPAIADECSKNDPCWNTDGGWAVVDANGIVVNIIVCKPSVCAIDGEFKGMIGNNRVVMQTGTNPVTGKPNPGYMSSDSAKVTESNGIFTITDTPNQTKIENTVNSDNKTTTVSATINNPTSVTTFSANNTDSSGMPVLTVQSTNSTSVTVNAKQQETISQNVSSNSSISSIETTTVINSNNTTNNKVITVTAQVETSTVLVETQKEVEKVFTSVTEPININYNINNDMLFNIFDINWLNYFIDWWSINIPIWFI